jgi:hypothetical protein
LYNLLTSKFVTIIPNSTSFGFRKTWL